MVAYRSRKLVLTSGSLLRRMTAPTFARGLIWTRTARLEGFVGGIGLIVIGLLLAGVVPHVVKTLRGTVDDLLPAATSPRDGASKP